MATVPVESSPTLEWVLASTEALASDCGRVRGVPHGFATALRAFAAGDQLGESEELWHAVQSLAGQALGAIYYGSVPEPIAWLRAAALTVLAECDHAMAEAQDSCDAESYMLQFLVLWNRVDRLERARAALGEAIEHLKVHASGTAAAR